VLGRDPVVDRPAQGSNRAAPAELARAGDGIPQRVQEMYSLHSGGRTLEQVGRSFGITRQRVSQLFQEASLPTVRRAAKPRKGARERQKRIARVALKDAARAVHGPFSADTFEALRRRTGAPWPSAPVIARAIGEGSWPGALEAVSIESVKDNRRARLTRRRALIADLWAREHTYTQIADLLNTTPGYVSVEVARMRKLGYELADRRRRRTS
jgi:DNA-binding CsgD family transcriptional regulator